MESNGYVHGESSMNRGCNVRKLDFSDDKEITWCPYFGYDEPHSGRYIMKRWKENVIPTNLLRTRNCVGEINREYRNELAHDTHSAVDYCIDILSRDTKKLEAFASKIHDLKCEVEAEFLNSLNYNSKKAMAESFLGYEFGEDTIRNPAPRRNRWEEAIAESSKPKRMCRRCGELAWHDKRNCPLKNESE
ncbi:hypothetical protein OSB04_018246 [Centaurea solstitialis]|uniref:Uncharacterized protein n=1 Tax=Centaurea solstitialis TaxID=347529 RepID=A0AA38TFD1_9ASTR|nr:hypothetical protein OSB04_018246 [Centaurea solstitialis]